MADFFLKFLKFFKPFKIGCGSGIYKTDPPSKNILVYPPSNFRAKKLFQEYLSKKHAFQMNITYSSKTSQHTSQHTHTSNTLTHTSRTTHHK